MAILGSERIPWSYTDDTGKVWRVAATEAITAQAVLGGSAAASTVPPKPSNIKMRRATVRSAAGVSRTVPLYDGTQTLVVGTTLGTINLNILQLETLMTAIGSVIPERRPRVSVMSTAS